MAPARSEQPITHLAHRTATAASGGRVMRCGASVRVCVRDGKSESDGAHEGNVGRVIAHTRADRGQKPELRAKACQRLKLVLDPLDHMADAELAAARADGRGAPPRDHCNLDAGSPQSFDAMTVAHVKCLQGLPAGAVVQAAIREHPVHIQHQKPNGSRGSGGSSVRGTH